VCKTSQRAICKTTLDKYDELYERLGTSEGEIEMYKLAKSREKQIRYILNVRCIRDEDKKVLTNDKEIINRRKRYFEKLVN